MSSASLPPLPALIPISVLRKSPLSNNNSEVGEENYRDCVPCINRKKVIDVQRRTRPARQSPDVLIDNSRSRDASAAPQSRKIRPERHRKSNRQRDRHRRAKTKSRSRDGDLCHHQDQPPINPRVNPIFVWVRQEDTRIVEVKCEDYDKRNRILLTKTPQGWRATPRTETLVPSQKEEDDRKHYHHHRSKKSKRNKVKQKSAAVQVEDLHYENDEDVLAADKQEESQPDWESPVNVETLLPSHTIHVHRKDSRRSEQSCSIENNVNSAVNESAQIDFKCSAETSPLDNLLAVAELEFNEQIQSGQWESSEHHQTYDKTTESDTIENLEMNEEQKDLMEDIEHLQNLIESCNQDVGDKMTTEDNIITTSQKEECDYTEDEENNLAMNDILSRLEQSLRSPEVIELEPSQCDTQEQMDKEIPNQLNEEGPNQCDNLTALDVNTSEISLDRVEPEDFEKSCDNPQTVDEPKQEQPTDLSLKTMRDLTIEIPPRNDYCEQPTDLSLPRENKLSQSEIYRPPSQNSEALQSPQPSGLPAVLPSPGIVSPGNIINIASNVKDKSAIPETNHQIPELSDNPEIMIESQKKPLDLGKCRKSASPTVTCSQEVNSPLIEDEPPVKKPKTSEPVTLEERLAVESKTIEDVSQSMLKSSDPSNKDLDITPLTQLNQLLLDESLNIPDPMLVPKKILRKIISNPGKEIPELLNSRPELRLPEALEFPHLLQDPDILVITIQQLEEIIKQQSPMPKKLQKPNDKTVDKKSTKTNDKEDSWKRGMHETGETIKFNNYTENKEAKSSNDYGDMDIASNAALNQLLWLPYMNQFEALQFSRNPDLMMALANSNMARTMPSSPNLSHLMSNNGFPSVPGNFRMPSYNSPFDMNLWQSSLLQAGLLGQKNATNSFDMRNPFKDLMGRANFEDMNRKYMHNQKYSMENKYAMQNQFFQPPPSMSSLSNPYMNHSQACQANIKTRMPVASQTSSGTLKNSNPQNTRMSNAQRQHMQEKPYNQGSIRMKPVHKLMSNVKQQQKEDIHNQVHHSKERYVDGKTGHYASQPIDLSGASSTTVGGKSEVMKRQLIDSLNQLNHSRNDDVGEVGSTTASIEEMQEAHKHLWHPLFGTDKCHNNVWNLTPSMTISSE
ncbi:uncharacterized protein LOC123311648 [Coccinella septempunctata]|uniref:uncharacterized protein LOC123311648 n=1 Tax=Coccinella septempunctata TaxID=41139 RepID=UPI001D085868|nr:uncharacterized protein LOC123311648 [Coccinella septempunctata]